MVASAWFARRMTAILGGCWAEPNGCVMREKAREDWVTRIGLERLLSHAGKGRSG
jgi:hypothetical protein